MTALDGTRSELVRAAEELIDPERLADIVMAMAGVPSPTGEEGELARWAVDSLTGAGIEARYQPIDDDQGNAVARLRGDGTGPDLLLYAPIDTLTTGNPEEDLPRVGTALRYDMVPEPVRDGDYVIGLGASNPKGHAACLVAALEILHRAGTPLRGDVVLGLGAGGMPTNKRTAAHVRRYNAGQGNGCSFMLEQGVWADYALIAKPGWAVSWDEVGLCWFEVSVGGSYSYAGSRHRIDYRNAILGAGTVAAALEEWFAEYTARHTAGTVAPQGNIGAIEGGFMRMPAVSPATCRFVLDLRTSPASTPMSVKREFADAITRIGRAHPRLDIAWDMILAIPGTATDPESWVVRAAIEAWEAEEGRPHEPILGNSGATDANILRGRGVPTARIGMTRAGAQAPLPVDFPMGMNVVDVREMCRLTRHILRTTINTCTRTRADVGL
ncbi:M20/M25/M40 family metallo-hydrolase [Actinomadura nitritigenes]|uniref:M20/M25/M40 family metallo-hydrolase n=1 Tax=Actinomadura nitritigenes TaxID=134602 RepID=A0ABS3RE09_9ACTN|nr:peptidase dimerization domain-containing protein [Actinomadura nitritigenes]MBO2444335.1 M20/M25/M40 family metallo-hydrolase [Actinomadura nitritigenes]